MNGQSRLHEGMQVGFLTLIARIGTVNGIPYWECECECGRRVIKRSDVLVKAVKRRSRSRCGKGCTGRRHAMHEDDPGVDWGSVIASQYAWIQQHRRRTTPATT